MALAGGPRAGAATLPGGALVVDDSRSDRHLLVEMLSEAGIERTGIDCAATLSQARERLSVRPYDCILLDLSLPDSSGLDGLRVLAVAAPGVPIVIVTGHPADDLVFAALAEGADEFVCKSDLDPEVLSGVVRRAVRRRAGSRRIRDRTQRAGSPFEVSAAPSATLDGSGRILQVNAAWRAFARHGGASDLATGLGVNYLRVCDGAVGPWSEGAAEAAEGIRAVLRGDLSHFSMDHACPDQRERWFSLRVVPLGDRGGGAVVTHCDITAVKLAERSARCAGRDARPPLDRDGGLLAVVDDQGVIRRSTAAAEATFGFKVGAALGAVLDARAEPEGRAAFAAAYTDTQSEPGASATSTLRVKDTQDRWHELDVSVTSLIDDSSVNGMVVTAVDQTLSRRRQIVHHLETTLIQRFPASVIVLDHRGVVVSWNERAEQLYGIASAAAVGRSVADLRVGLPEATPRGAFLEEVAARGSWEGDYDARRLDGSVVPVHSLVEHLQEPAINFTGFLAISIDVSERRRLEEDLAFQALHDPLTSLPNRRLFIEHLEGALGRASRGATQAAVIYFDLDDFKHVNDSAGHAAGDEMLRTVGGLLRGLTREGNLAARLGGDEFVVCCDVVDKSEALQLADRLLAALRAPFLFEHRFYESRSSVGIAFSQPGIHAEGMLRNADMALYAAKEAGKDCIRVFDDTLHQLARDRRERIGDLREGIAGGQLVTFFQPEVELSTGCIRGFEALVRWAHPTLGLVSPAEFIALAEEEDLIGDLGLVVLREACAALRNWSELGPGAPMVSVNVSMRQLSDRRFIRTVAEEIRAAGIPPGLLCLELTESVLMEATAADEALTALEGLGVRIAIDDFGTGYSSLSRLKRFPVDYLKIDKSFVDGLPRQGESAAIVSLILNLAATLGLETIAEGIETDGQRQALLELGCELGQGYLWSRPVPFAEAHALLRCSPGPLRGAGSPPAVA